MRQAERARKTNETDIQLTLALEGAGRADIATGCGFLDHMLTLFTAHGRFDLTLRCAGDTRVDYHHTTEDVGIALGEAFAAALEEKRGIYRYGHCVLPMDEALMELALDLSGRAGVYGGLLCPSDRVGDFDTELAWEFLWGLARAMGMTLHVRQLAGENTHHILEALFKALGRALKQAVALDPARLDEIPSTKGTL